MQKMLGVGLILLVGLYGLATAESMIRRALFDETYVWRSVDERLSGTKWCSPILINHHWFDSQYRCDLDESLVDLQVKYRNPYEYGGYTRLSACMDKRGRITRLLRAHERMHY